jgi:polar amino acid transport system substrate-binding protein
MGYTRLIFIAVGAAILAGGAGLPAEAENPVGRSLRVGTKPAPPFVLKSDNGYWTGISIDLWRRIAEELQIAYEFEERDLEGLLGGLEDGSLDISVAALTITAGREKRIDFTYPFYSTGLAIAASPESHKSWIDALRGFVSFRFLQVVGALVLLLLIVGCVIWLVERRRNPEQFGGGRRAGIGSGFWWSAVTMTTVGYGDKAPRTFWGRLLGLVWMFAGIIIISSFTAAITTSLTVTRLESKIGGPGDLPDFRVATVPGTASAAYLEVRRIAYEACDTPRDGLQAIAASRIDAVVYDAPILHYLAEHEFKGDIMILPGLIERQDYGIGLPSGSDLREPINQVILKIVSQPVWDDILERYLGRVH